MDVFHPGRGAHKALTPESTRPGWMNIPSLLDGWMTSRLRGYKCLVLGCTGLNGSVPADGWMSSNLVAL